MREQDINQCCNYKIKEVSKEAISAGKAELQKKYKEMNLLSFILKIFEQAAWVIF